MYMSLSVIYGLLASLSVGFSLAFVKKSYEELPPSVVFAFQALFGVLIWIPFSLYVGIVPTFSLLLWLSLIALVSAIVSEAFYYYIFTKGDVGIISAVFSTYPLFTIASAFLLLGERPPVVLILFALVIIIGIFILSLTNKANKNANKNKAILWGLIGASSVGFVDTLSKGVIDATSASTFLLALAIMQVPVALIFLRCQGQTYKQFIIIFTHISKYIYAIIGAILGVIGVLFMWLTFEATYASIASPLSGAYPVFTIMLAYLWLKEKLSILDIVGSIVIIVGVIGIGSFI